MKQYTFKYIGLNMFQQSKEEYVTPSLVEDSEFVKLGARKPITVVLIKRDLLPESQIDTILDMLPKLPSDVGGSVLQYNAVLGGYLYAWFK